MMLIDKTKSSLIMLVGIPASGKSYVANMMLNEGNEIDDFNIVVHSSDALRAELFGDVNEQGQNNELFKELHKRIIEDLRKGNTVIYDATNINRKRRIAFLNELKHNKVKCKKICVLVLATYEECVLNNSKRERSVPQNVIERMYKHFEPPIIQEGWDSITVVYNVNDPDSMYKYTIDQFFTGETDACSIDQDNKHHSKTIGDHCIATYEYLKKSNPDDTVIQVAGLLHDCGKPFTKSRRLPNGTEDNQSHYYNHANVGAYDSFFYTMSLQMPYADRVSVAHLICEHMKPFDWKLDKTKEKYKKLYGKLNYDRLIDLNEADKKTS